jgi:hypothetical protein
MGDPKQSLVQRALDKALGFVGLGKPDKKKKGYKKEDFPMARILTKEEAAANDVAGMDSVYGRQWRTDIKEGKDPILPGPGGKLPRADATNGLTAGGFFNRQTDAGGNPIGPPRGYATPATHWAPQRGIHRDTFLASQYDFRKARGEKLPPWDEWLAAQGRGRK